MGIVGQRRLQSVRADSRRKRKLGKIRQRNCVFDLLALRAEREGAEVSGDPNRKSAVRAVALIVAAELIERRETKWPDADAVFRRSIVAGDPYIVAIVGMVCLASGLPAYGSGTIVARYATNAAIALLFFLHGARLSPQECPRGGDWATRLG